MFYPGNDMGNVFNDSLGELKYLQFIEINWADAYLKKDVSSLYDFTFLYFMALTTRAKFDGSNLMQQLLGIRSIIARLDHNKDGSISAEEKNNNAGIYGSAWDNLISIYMQLGEIKVKSGWSLKTRSQDQLEQDRLLRDLPVLNVK